MRALVGPHLEGVLKAPPVPQTEILHLEGLSGRYIPEMQSEWRHD
jgi:hypothetical protein